MARRRRRRNHESHTKTWLITLLVVVLVVVGGVFVMHFDKTERQRDMDAWKVRLGLVADNQLKNVANWVEVQYASLRNLAENASLQLYMTELSLLEGGVRASDEPAQASFLRNLLTVTAERDGFITASTAGDVRVRANVERVGVSGIALLDKEGQLVVSTRGMPPMEGRLQRFVENAPRGERHFLDMYIGPTGEPTMAFLAPVFAIQGDREPSQQIGSVLGVKTVGGSLYPLLEPPATAMKTSESYLARVRGNFVEFLSPLSDGTKPLSRKVDSFRPDFAVTSFDVDSFPTSNFGVRQDYNGVEILATVRRVDATGWVLVHKIEAAVALAESAARRTRLIGIFTLSILLTVVIIVAVWRHGSSIRMEKEAHHYKQLAEHIQGQEHLLRLVTDNQPDHMFIVDKDNRYCFANYEAALNAGINEQDMIGKTIESVLGPHKGEEYKRVNEAVLKELKTIVEIHHMDDKIFQSKHIPLAKVPSILSDEETNGVLIVEQDITEVMEERERSERMLENLVTTLVTIIDRRNPYASNHSSRVARLAGIIAQDMGLDETMVGSTETAGNLMNLGKILLPAELLTKVEALSEEEMKNVYESIYASADFLETIEFRGPVVETLRQCQEHWDGNGPKGLKGEEILISARIIAVANAFIAMVSPRAYRPSIGKEKAIENLMNQIGAKYDRHVVVALVNYIENHAGDEEWWEEA